MSWRTVLISRRAKLDLKLNHLVLRRPNELVKIFLDEIAVLIIESTAVSITAALLNECRKRKIKIIFCDEYHQPALECFPLYGSHDSSGCLKEQLSWSPLCVADVWASIIREKIMRQAEVLKPHHQEGASLLLTYAEQIEPLDVTNREAHAGKVYFNRLFGAGFSRSDGSAINAALDYGYALILAPCNREIVAAGYNTQLGLFHRNQFNPYNLGSDVMEPYRPLVDHLVKKFEPTEFLEKERRTMLTIFDQKVSIGGKKRYILDSIRVYVHSIFRALRHEDISLLRFYRNEL